MAGFTAISVKPLVGTTARRLSDLFGVDHADAVIFTPGPGSIIYVGNSNVSSSNGFLVSLVGDTLPRPYFHNQYDLRNIYVIGSSVSDWCGILIIAEGAAAQATPPAETFYLLTENNEALLTEGSDHLIQELAP